MKNSQNTTDKNAAADAEAQARINVSDAKRAVFDTKAAKEKADKAWHCQQASDIKAKAEAKKLADEEAEKLKKANQVLATAKAQLKKITETKKLADSVNNGNARNLFVVVVIILALLLAAFAGYLFNNKEIQVADATKQVVDTAVPQVIDQATGQVVDTATPKVVDAAIPQVTEDATELVVKKAIPKVVDESVKVVVPQVVKQATPQVVKQATPQVVKAAVPKVVKQATPQVIAKAIPPAAKPTNVVATAVAPASAKAIPVAKGEQSFDASGFWSLLEDGTYIEFKFRPNKDLQYKATRVVKDGGMVYPQKRQWSAQKYERTPGSFLSNAETTQIVKKWELPGGDGGSHITYLILEVVPMK
ncbi:MAG: hypothetical protein PF549_02060 [Patescibacteria group bacterium]|jgi:hypothetical protein|nr:hypothetical protein [Patescibacteria group bacterium]